MSGTNKDGSNQKGGKTNELSEQDGLTSANLQLTLLDVSKVIPLFAVGLAIVIAILYWKLSESSDTREHLRGAEPQSAVKSLQPVELGLSHVSKPIESVGPASRPADAPSPADVAPAKEHLNPESEEFIYRVEVQIPDRLRAAGADACDLDFTSDAKLKFSYRLNVVGGRVSVENLKVVSSEVSDVTEQCLRNAIEAATWTVDDMDDFHEDSELFLRMRALRKYESRKEFDE